MDSIWKRSIRFFRFYLKAKTVFDAHSPFVYEFASKVLEDKRTFYAFEELKVLRKKLVRDHTRITITDFGAGSTKLKSNQRTIAELTRFVSSPPFVARQLFRAVQLYKPKQVIEMGTSIGLTSLFLAYNSNIQLWTMEGCPQTAAVAQRNFQIFRKKNIRQVIGPFEQTLQQTLDQIDKLDLVYFDGDHRKEPVIDYFEDCLKKAHNNTVFIFDDIHWSKGMEQAWAYIRNHDQVSLTIDLFFSGYVFFRNEFHEKQHFSLVRSSWKPWRMGLRL